LKKLDKVEEKKMLKAQRKRSVRAPIRLYLDACNLPLGLRGADDNRWQLISKRIRNPYQDVVEHFDWIPSFRSILQNTWPLTERVIIMFDGSKYVNHNILKPGLEKIMFPNMNLIITERGEESDTRLARITKEEYQVHSKLISKDFKKISIEQVIKIFEDIAVDVIDYQSGICDESKNDECDFYVVARRIGGRGAKQHKNLFNRLNLMRPNEGALCLTGISARVLRRSLMIAKELKRSNVKHLVEYELRPRNTLKTIVFTDDILLADRVVNEGGAVLSYYQMLDLDQE